MKRTLTTAFLALAIAAGWLLAHNPLPSVQAANTPTVTLNVQNSAPRQIEDQTQKAVSRDYAAAWQAMPDALDQNRADLLSANFVGTASYKLTETIQEQNKAGLHR